MSNYWKERFLKEEQRVYDLSEEEIKKQIQEYDKAIASLNKDIEIWYNRIAKNNVVSLAEAKRLLSAKELKEFRWTVDEYIKHGKENGITKDWSKQLENASARVHIERLEALKLKTRGQIEKLYNGRESGFKNFLKNVYTDQHQRTAFEFAKETGVGTNFYKINENLVEDIIKKPWALDGKNFSDRIWSDKEKLINTLHTEMTQGFIRGDSLEDITKRITAKMNVSKSNVKRLVRTESAAYRSKAQLKAFQDLEVEKYQVLATLDTRTSDICQDMDGKVFDFKDYEIGTTAPPFHVNCRSVTIPYFDDEEEGERAARDPETGKTVYVSDKMTYKEWKQKFLVEKDMKEEIVENGKLSPNEIKIPKNEIDKLNDKEKNIENIGNKSIIKVRGNIPKTLENYQKHFENWYNSNLKNLVSEEDEKMVSKILKDVIDKSDFAMRYKINYIENLIESGRFKNIFETNTSGGAISPIIKKFRKQAPINLFGTTEKLKKIDYEKYGYITDKSFLNDYNSKMNDTLKMYGDVIIKFNKENLKNKVTFTVNDSLGNVVREKVIASSVDKPGIHSMEMGKIKSYTDILRKNKINNVLELIDELKVRYLETQYHGELLLSDVTSVCFTDRIPDNESLNNLKKLGIKLYRIEGGKIVEI